VLPWVLVLAGAFRTRLRTGCSLSPATSALWC